jgi:hypothetical protein
LANASAAAVPVLAAVRHQMTGGKPSSTARSAAVGGRSDPQSPEPDAPQRSKPRHTAAPTNLGQLSVYRFSQAFTWCSSSAHSGLAAKAPARVGSAEFPFLSTL